MTKKRFPADWSAAELLKQYMKNYRRYAVRNGRMKSRTERNGREEDQAESGSGEGASLPNVDQEDPDTD
jgi:hypothetical protein